MDWTRLSNASSFFDPLQRAVRRGFAGSLGQLVSFFLQIKNPLFPGHDQAIESFEFQDSFLQFSLGKAVPFVGFIAGFFRVDGQRLFLQGKAVLVSHGGLRKLFDDSHDLMQMIGSR